MHVCTLDNEHVTAQRVLSVRHRIVEILSARRILYTYTYELLSVALHIKLRTKIREIRFAII